VPETGIAGCITSWQPSSMSPQAADFARAVVALVAPAGRERAKNLLWAAGRLADRAIGLGLEPSPQVLLHSPVTGRFTAHAPGLSGPARRTLRTNLRFIARQVVPALAPADAPLPREHARAPYSPAETGGYLALADAQPTPARRMRAAGLVCLGAGAGLIRSACAGCAAVTSPAAPAASSQRYAAPGRGPCRSWPATTSRCWPPRRSPGPAW
jgi:hypothetical protein